MRHALGDFFRQMPAIGKTPEEVEKNIDSGRLTVLFDDNGEFIKESFKPLPTTSS